MRCELLDVEGSFNVRDLGGYAVAGGRVTKHRRFLRAGSLAGLTKRGRQALLDAGARCVIDLRSAHEICAFPNALQNDGEFEYHHIPMLDYIRSSGNSGATDNFPASMEDLYIGLLEESGAQFRRVFGLFADSRYDCTIFHCTAGKDRTGVIAMLLLDLAGTDSASIAEDYSYSEALQTYVPQEDDPSGFPMFVFYSKPQTMLAVLARLHERYGGARGYLSHIGVTPGQIESVLDKFLGI